MLRRLSLFILSVLGLLALVSCKDDGGGGYTNSAKAGERVDFTAYETPANKRAGFLNYAFHIIQDKVKQDPEDFYARKQLACQASYLQYMKNRDPNYSDIFIHDAMNQCGKSAEVVCMQTDNTIEIVRKCKFAKREIEGGR